jgi:hypothetical protein
MRPTYTSRKLKSRALQTPREEKHGPWHRAVQFTHTSRQRTLPLSSPTVGSHVVRSHWSSPHPTSVEGLQWSKGWSDGAWLAHASSPPGAAGTTCPCAPRREDTDAAGPQLAAFTWGLAPPSSDPPGRLGSTPTANTGSLLSSARAAGRVRWAWRAWRSSGSRPPSQRIFG